MSKRKSDPKTDKPYLTPTQAVVLTAITICGWTNDRPPTRRELFTRIVIRPGVEGIDFVVEGDPAEDSEPALGDFVLHQTLRELEKWPYAIIVVRPDRPMGRIPNHIPLVYLPDANLCTDPLEACIILNIYFWWQRMPKPADEWNIMFLVPLYQESATVMRAAMDAACVRGYFAAVDRSPLAPDHKPFLFEQKPMTPTSRIETEFLYLSKIALVRADPLLRTRIERGD